MVRVIDAKSSRKMKFSHEIQVGFYAMLLESLIETHGIEDLEVCSKGAVWYSEILAIHSLVDSVSFDFFSFLFISTLKVERTETSN